jgi:hypothetical protein
MAVVLLIEVKVLPGEKIVCKGNADSFVRKTLILL